jgi:hypothetical protein
LSMSINITFTGDVDRLPHKDLAEKIIRQINEAVMAATGEEQHETGYAVRHTTVGRPFLGDRPYDSTPSEYIHVVANWVVHIDDDDDTDDDDD